MVDSKSAEDIAPEASSYPYAWSPESAEERPLDGFLNKVCAFSCSLSAHESLTLCGIAAKFKPSMVQDDGTKPVRVSCHA